MNAYAKVAVAAVLVVAVGAIGLAVLRPGGSSQVGGPPSPSLSPEASSSPSPASGAFVPPELSQTFTSDIHGLTISYPDGWTAHAATVPTTTPIPFLFQDPSVDTISDPIRRDHLFVMLASQSLDGTTFDEWSAGLADECPATEPVVVDGADGVIADTASERAAPDQLCALVSMGDRGYVIVLYVSGDEADLRAFDGRPWFEEILATVQLQPQDAVEAPPSTAP